jgi:hypothetical protein
MGMHLHRRTLALGTVFMATSAAAMFGACTDSYRLSSAASTGGGGPGVTHSASSAGGGGGLGFDSGQCQDTCSNDLKSVVDCKGVVKTPCTVDQGCANAMCIDDPCKAAELSKSSYGCDYWALKTAQNLAPKACFAAFVANTWGKPVHLHVEYDGKPLAAQDGGPPKLAGFVGIPKGQGPLPTSLTYTPYDDTNGLGVGEVAILFLSRKSVGGAGLVACPMGPAIDGETGVDTTGIGKAFHITSDYPVVAYQMVPFGGGQAGVTSATLLLPTSAWDTNYIAINAYKSAEPDGITGGNPSLDIIAYKDATDITILPKVDIVAGNSIPGSPANTPAKFTLNAGEFIQITQPAELTGSVIQSSLPVGVFGASACMDVPLAQNDCDSAQQQLPPVRALGSEYVGVRYRGRGGGMDEVVPWRIVGAVNGTMLTWEPAAPAGAPKSIGLGEVAEFKATGPFVVKSQDGDHPFYLGGYMTGGGLPGGLPFGGEGDPDWVNVIAPAQYLNHYVMFTDPTYPETNLVIIRTPSQVDQKFADVTLNCAGSTMPQTLGGWQPIGSYEYTRVDLVTGNFMSVNDCSNGRQEISSALPFGVTVWGWGNTTETKQVSYAYPAGAGFLPINAVMIPPIPH